MSNFFPAVVIYKGVKFIKMVQDRLGNKYIIFVFCAETPDQKSSVDIYYKGKEFQKVTEEVFDAMILHFETIL